MGQLVLDKGMWNGKRVVSDTWIAESVKRHLPLAEGALGGSPYTTGFLGIFPTLNTVVVLNNGEWGQPRERVFDYDVIVEKWILPALR